MIVVLLMLDIELERAAINLLLLLFRLLMWLILMLVCGKERGGRGALVSQKVRV